MDRYTKCRKRVQGRHALQTSDAPGAASVRPGPNIASFVVEMHVEHGVPLDKIVRVLTRFGLRVTKGAPVATGCQARYRVPWPDSPS